MKQNKKSSNVPAKLSPGYSLTESLTCFAILFAGRCSVTVNPRSVSGPTSAMFHVRGEHRFLIHISK